jgi:hypothetical protein
VKIRDEGLVRNKAVHIALGVRADATKEILGRWLEQNEGATFWLRVMNELKNRGVRGYGQGSVRFSSASALANWEGEWYMDEIVARYRRSLLAARRCFLCLKATCARPK